MVLHPSSVLFITLDSCRYDTAVAASAPNIKGLGALHRVFAPGTFTYSSHAAMFMGFTPGEPLRRQPYVNPKYAKIFRLSGGGSSGPAQPYITLSGRSIVHGFRRRGYAAYGTGAVAWFDPYRPTSRVLTRDFHRFFFPGNTYSIGRQMAFIDRVVEAETRPVFLFMNVGETHVPYYFNGAPWDRLPSPCVPFGEGNDASECRRRQVACLEFVDRALGPLLDRFRHANTVLCADHGDAWGEDGMWEHGIHHPKVLEVPLILRLNGSGAPDDEPLGMRIWSGLARGVQSGRRGARRARRLLL